MSDEINERVWDCCGEPCVRGMRVDSCKGDPIEFPTGETLPPIPYEPDYGGADQRCHDCAIARGGYHHPGCDMERCPKCEGQMIGCGCLSDEAYEAWQRTKADLAAANAREQALRAALEDVRGRVHVQVHGGHIVGATPADQCYRWICDVVNNAILAAEPEARAGELMRVEGEDS